MGSPSCSFGQLREGDVLTLIQRPRPAWPLRRVATLLYDNGLAKDAGYQAAGCSWRYLSEAADPSPPLPLAPDVMEDLKMLRSFEELPRLEWRDVIDQVLSEFFLFLAI